MTLIKTTLRIPAELHRQLRITAAEQNTTSEKILQEALQRELERLGGAKRRTIDFTRDVSDLLAKRSHTLSPLLAELFMQSVPTFCVIKDAAGRIVWANFFFEDTIGVPLSQAGGKTIGDVANLDGLERETVERNIASVSRERPTKTTEGLTLKGTTMTIRAERFMFGDPPMHGDVSFIERQIRRASFDVRSDVPSRMQRSLPDPAVEPLFPEFLWKAPVASSFKLPEEGDSIIVWGSEQYVALAGGKKVQGERTSKVFGLKKDDPIFASERTVLETQRALMTKEKLRGHRDERWSLRFPIFDQNGRIALIGVISPNFMQEEGD